MWLWWNVMELGSDVNCKSNSIQKWLMSPPKMQCEILCLSRALFLLIWPGLYFPISCFCHHSCWDDDVLFTSCTDELYNRVNQVPHRLILKRGTVLTWKITNLCLHVLNKMSVPLVLVMAVLPEELRWKEWHHCAAIALRDKDRVTSTLESFHPISYQNLVLWLWFQL